ncbi:DUF5017 domain-containing protein [Parapedobacter sp. SGR-10]|uniref:DUF5017 domain-containing protein n=1 Tax=Parapedobacter sp. SGR-10 TaxID=2710879 RepID=UPI0013D7D340|nr:DUF5017 domain-containing protein [Parapedobacter sp. SGR-10]NGF58017.1 DUF5017 domain-containing protein [Parapedobacter sp. SGR-10]
MNKLFYLLSASVILLGSCEYKMELTPNLDDFAVSTGANVYRVNEIVDFKLKGNPDIITFYSGELYNDYAHKDGRIIRVEHADLYFTTSIPVTARPQENQFAVMASTDFNGDYSSWSNIDDAHWVDITDRFILATSITFTSSGVVDISDLIEPGKPLFIGFKYTVRSKAEINDPAHERPRTWHIQSFTFTGNTDAGPLVMGDMETAGFNIIHQHPEIVSKTVQSASRITFLGHPMDEPTDPDIHTEIWAVSKPFETGDVNRGPDRPIAVKADLNPRLESYTHTYTKPGIYKAYFVGMNANIEGSQQVIREVDVTVIAD